MAQQINPLLRDFLYRKGMLDEYLSYRKNTSGYDHSKLDRNTIDHTLFWQNTSSRYDWATIDKEWRVYVDSVTACKSILGDPGSVKAKIQYFAGSGKSSRYMKTTLSKATKKLFSLNRFVRTLWWRRKYNIVKFVRLIKIGEGRCEECDGNTSCMPYKCPCKITEQLKLKHKFKIKKK
jgi:hypothetical protein